MKQNTLFTLSMSTYTYVSLLVALIFGVAISILYTPSAHALLCDDIAYSDHYCDFGNSIDSDNFVPAGGNGNTGRDPAKRLEVIRMLQARKSSQHGGGRSVTPYIEPVVLLDEEIEILEIGGLANASTLSFLEAMEDMMEGTSHQDQLNIILNVSKSLYTESSTSLAKKGLHKQQIGEVLYYVVLRYLINSMPGIDIITSSSIEHDVAEESIEDDISDDDNEEEVALSTEEEEELEDIIEEIFGDI